MGNTADTVRDVTSESRNIKIDKKTIEALKAFSGKSRHEIGRRISELEEEWDIERALTLNAALLATSGVLLSLKDKRWLILSGVVGSFLAQHALMGWCPPVEIFRALGFRTRQEIEREKYALKALRGDFRHVDSARKAWEQSQ